MSKTNTSLDELSLPRACLHLKSTVITPVTSNNCRVSLLLMEVQFLLKDAWSSNCCHDCGRQVFVFWGLGKKQQEQLRETVPSSLLLPPGLNPQLWLQEEMNHYFPFVIRQRMLTHSPLTAAGPGRSERRPGDTALPRRDTAEGNAGLSKGKRTTELETAQ